MFTLNFMLGVLLLSAVPVSLGKVTEDEDGLESELLETILRKLVEEETEEKRSNEESRIIGGTALKEGNHPWLVSLQAKIPSSTFLGLTISSKKMYCGGTLIKKRWILTAAHCFVNSDIGSRARTPEYWTARLGETERQSGIFDTVVDFFGDVFGYSDWQTWEIKGEKIIIYKGYDAKDHWKNDIALLKLEKEVPPEEVLVGQVKLPAQGDSMYPIPGNICVAMGWGCTKSGDTVSDIALRVEVKAISPETCRSTWRVDMETRVCAGGQKKGRGICSGDSGGPLMCKRNGQWYQAGIASFAEAENPQNFPGVFTRVSSYRSWIDSKTKE